MAAGGSVGVRATRICRSFFIGTRVSSELTRVQSGLMRGQGRLTLAWRPLKSFRLAGAYDLAGKVFFTLPAL